MVCSAFGFLWERHLAAISMPRGHYFNGKMPLPQKANPNLFPKPAGWVICLTRSNTNKKRVDLSTQFLEPDGKWDVRFDYREFV
jgi:hypothetical protein